MILNEFIYSDEFMSFDSAGVIPYFWGQLPLFAFRAEKVAKMILLLSVLWAIVMSIIIILRVQTPAFGHCAWLAIILINMMVFVASAAQARARMRARA